MFCHDCGKEIQDGMKFCKHCGKAVADGLKEAESSNEPLGSLWRSMQDTAKNVGEALNKAVEENKERNENAEKKKRFNVTPLDVGLFGTSLYIIVDKTTGVNYLMTTNNHAGGLTVLVDKDGKPLVTQLA